MCGPGSRRGWSQRRGQMQPRLRLPQLLSITSLCVSAHSMHTVSTQPARTTFLLGSGTTCRTNGAGWLLAGGEPDEV